jgi:xylitol oxidase
VLLVSEVRTVRADAFWLSPAHGRDTLAIHFTWRYEPDAVREVVALIEQRLAPYDPRPHWGKVTASAPTDIGGRYEKLADFRDLADRLDPTGKFRNRFVEELLGG